MYILVGLTVFLAKFLKVQQIILMTFVISSLMEIFPLANDTEPLKSDVDQGEEKWSSDSQYAEDLPLGKNEIRGKCTRACLDFKKF